MSFKISSHPESCNNRHRPALACAFTKRRVRRRKRLISGTESMVPICCTSHEHCRSGSRQLIFSCSEVAERMCHHPARRWSATTTARALRSEHRHDCTLSILQPQSAFSHKVQSFLFPRLVLGFLSQYGRNGDKPIRKREKLPLGWR